jgi:hypothetical protein
VKIPNIGPRGRRQRLTLGVVSLGVAAVLGTVVLAVGAAPGWRLGLFVPLWLGALGIFQALDKT